MTNPYDYSKILCNTPPEVFMLPIDVQLSHIKLQNELCSTLLNVPYPSYNSGMTLNDIRNSMNLCDAQQASLNSMINACCANTEDIYANNCVLSVTDAEEDLDEGPIGLTIIDCEKEDKRMTAIRNGLKYIIKLANREIAGAIIQILLALMFVACSICGIILFFLKYGGFLFHE